MPRLDSQTLFLISALLILGFWVFNKTAQGKGKLQGAGWGPLAGSGPGIQPEVVTQACPSHQEQRKRDAELQQVAPYNPASFDFASVQ
jgi:hypothetical protein